MLCIASAPSRDQQVRSANRVRKKSVLPRPARPPAGAPSPPSCPYGRMTTHRFPDPRTGPWTGRRKTLSGCHLAPCPTRTCLLKLQSKPLLSSAKTMINIEYSLRCRMITAPQRCAVLTSLLRTELHIRESEKVGKSCGREGGLGGLQRLI